MEVRTLHTESSRVFRGEEGLPTEEKRPLRGSRKANLMRVSIRAELSQAESMEGEDWDSLSFASEREKASPRIRGWAPEKQSSPGHGRGTLGSVQRSHVQGVPKVLTDELN